MLKFYRQEKKIATPIAFLFLLIVFFITYFAMKKLPIFFKKLPAVSIKAKDNTVEKIEITNLANNSVSIFWKTQQKETGWVIYGENKDILDMTSSDSRDSTSEKKYYLIHYAVLKDLKENKTYFFKIITNKGVFSSFNNAPFEFTTSSEFNRTTDLKPAFGKVINKNGKPVSGGVVILRISGVYSLSALTSDAGEWLIPLYFLKTYDAKNFLLPSPDTLTTIESINNEGEMSLVTTTLKNISPLPQTIVIGINFQFKEEKTNVLSTSTAENSADLDKINDVDIIFPKENAVIAGKKPIFKGTARPFEKIKVVISQKLNKNTRQFEIYANDKGIWNLTVPYSFNPGDYNIFIETKDKKNKTVKVNHNFAILKSGESVLGEATPEATITLSAPSVAPSATLPPIPSPTLGVIISPTITSPKETETSTPVLSEVPPQTGINFIPFSIMGVVLIMAGLGFLIAL